MADFERLLDLDLMTANAAIDGQKAMLDASNEAPDAKTLSSSFSTMLGSAGASMQKGGDITDYQSLFDTAAMTFNAFYTPTEMSQEGLSGDIVTSEAKEQEQAGDEDIRDQVKKEAFKMAAKEVLNGVAPGLGEAAEQTGVLDKAADKAFDSGNTKSAEAGALNALSASAGATPSPSPSMGGG